MKIKMENKIDKVLALLAKAESTPFEAERDVFLAKARELMTAYRIDEADLVAASGACGDDIGKDDVNVGKGPYVVARFYLLGDIAHAFDCDCVSWSGRDGRRVEVWGFESDRRIVQVLYASLLMQALESSLPEGRLSQSERRIVERDVRRAPSG